jgi:hypothetical protein
MVIRNIETRAAVAVEARVGSCSIVVCSPDSHHLAVGHGSSLSVVEIVDEHKVRFSVEIQRKAIAQLRYNSMGDRIVTSTAIVDTIVWNAFDGTVLSRIHEDVSLALFLADSYDVLLARRYAECATWSPETSDALEQNKWSAVLGRQAEIHPSSGIVGWTNKNGRISLSVVKDGQVLFTSKHPSLHAVCLCFAPSMHVLLL